MRTSFETTGPRRRRHSAGAANDVGLPPPLFRIPSERHVHATPVFLALDDRRKLRKIFQRLVDIEIAIQQGIIDGQDFPVLMARTHAAGHTVQ